VCDYTPGDEECRLSLPLAGRLTSPARRVPGVLGQALADSELRDVLHPAQRDRHSQLPGAPGEKPTPAAGPGPSSPPQQDRWESVRAPVAAP